jgi:hypothetical protein
MSWNIVIMIFHKIHSLPRYTSIIHDNLYDKWMWSLSTFLWFQNIEKSSGSWAKRESFACRQFFQSIGRTYLNSRTHLYTNLYRGLVKSRERSINFHCLPFCFFHFVFLSVQELEDSERTSWVIERCVAKESRVGWWEFSVNPHMRASEERHGSHVRPEIV